MTDKIQKSLDTATVAAVRAYAEQARTVLGAEEASVISYAGLWLLLASLAPVAGTDIEALGLSRADARAAALGLLDDPHPTVAAAVAGWLRPEITLRRALPVLLDPLPAQAGLDAWAAEHTRNLIEKFPLKVDARTLLVLASALVLTPKWQEPLGEDEHGRLVLRHGLQAIVETDAAGLVAVAVPATRDRVDVLSVIAADSVAPADVWRAVDEVVARLEQGELRSVPAEGLTDGHAWTVSDRTERTPVRTPAVQWRSHLPTWSVRADHDDLLSAPGVAEVAAGLVRAFPPIEEIQQIAGLENTDRIEAECVQSATATYDENGFSAAAVTAFSLQAATAAPRFEERVIRYVDVTFDRPHALVAVARGGAWDGLPLFHCWVNAGSRPRG